MESSLYIKELALSFKNKQVKGNYTDIDGERYYKITNYDSMRPFFISIVSNSDHWMFISSNGALSAGRQNSQHALFPYYSSDKISDSEHITGSKTIIHINHDGAFRLWEPFTDSYYGVYDLSRNLYKNFHGNKILFEEINNDLGVVFRYSWENSDKYGFVRQSCLINQNDFDLDFILVDGIQNILPPGVDVNLQNASSNLVDAYKKSELDPGSGLGMFSLSAVIVDRPVPSESLSTTLAYAIGIDDSTRLLSSVQLYDFKKTGQVTIEHDIKAERGAYFVYLNETLSKKKDRQWITVLETDQDLSDISRINKLLKDHDGFRKDVLDDIKRGTEILAQIVASADGLQTGNTMINDNRHFANVLFNIMRGGLPDDNYKIPVQDFKQYIAHYNKELFEEKLQVLESMPSNMDYMGMIDWAVISGDRDLERLAIEYLPFVFSRRHGDPSRPWNQFSIDLKDSYDEKIYNYEGNWRDIFQNWEALALSHPNFIMGMISKFLNASTLDGYNPYRITKEGIDWEAIEEDDPWSFIGYWGDHQVIYLLKLLEVCSDYFPSKLPLLLSNKIFSFANVPYIIKSYEETVNDPRDTIVFDHDKEAKILSLVEKIGSDGKLVLDKDGKVYKANLAEKLLIMILTKFSNFIPEAGIWLNTQRPEWNDANNALVGNGVSMVTLYYMYRFQEFVNRLFSLSDDSSFEVSVPLKEFLVSITDVLVGHESILKAEFSDKNRRKIMDGLGKAGETYRKSVYNRTSLYSTTTINVSDIQKFIEVSTKYLKQSIHSNKRSDGLYHSYNLIELNNPGEARIDRLYEMLEGQVSALSAGLLRPAEALEVLDALSQSAIYRADQNSYILYPDRDLPRFQQKNNIPSEAIKKSKLLQKLVEDDNREIVYTDLDGGFHFNVSFNNNEKLISNLEKLEGTKYEQLVREEKQIILDIYEDMFDHKSFTGRSGTFFGYEGLGSIYWHMVSKLRLAVFENYYWALEKGADNETLKQLKEHYYNIEKGLGNNKDPELYGAFPMDPYSHTPAHRGAQQPGMTGQVKEDIIARFGELGVRIKEGQVRFTSSLFRKEELLSKESFFEYYNVKGQKKSLTLKKGSLAFTYCNIPIVYQFSEIPLVRINYSDGRIEQQSPLILSQELSQDIFDRNGNLDSIEVSFKK